MREFLFFRHGLTPGNAQGRYVGRTDESLSPQGRSALSPCRWKVDVLYTSPMRRCLESAQVICPGLAPIVVPDFRECDFGAFEYRNHVELGDDPRYQAWIDSGGRLPFPEGENSEAFRARCRSAFQPLLEDSTGRRAALVVHGGTIMAILSGFALPRRDYFDYQVKNGRGYRCGVENGGLRVIEEL